MNFHNGDMSDYQPLAQWPSATARDRLDPCPPLFGLDSQRYGAALVRGDSMHDTLSDGDRVIVDRFDRNISQGGIFALLDEQERLVIKQVEIVRDAPRRTIVCKSRNPSYAAFQLELKEPVRILGRVAQKVTRFV